MAEDWRDILQGQILNNFVLLNGLRQSTDADTREMATELQGNKTYSELKAFLDKVGKSTYVTHSVQTTALGLTQELTASTHKTLPVVPSTQPPAQGQPQVQPLGQGSVINVFPGIGFGPGGGDQKLPPVGWFKTREEAVKAATAQGNQVPSDLLGDRGEHAYDIILRNGLWT